MLEKILHKVFVFPERQVADDVLVLDIRAQEAHLERVSGSLHLFHCHSDAIEFA